MLLPTIEKAHKNHNFFSILYNFCTFASLIRNYEHFKNSRTIGKQMPIVC
jgi:hypothetical protein